MSKGLDKEVVEYFVPGRLYRAKKDYHRLFYNKSRTDGIRKEYWKENDIVMLARLELDEEWSQGDYSEPHGELTKKFSFTVLSNGEMFNLNGRDERTLFKHFELVKNPEET